MKLSLCIATYNEEANLHYPLDSAYDLVDEVIIVDGGSTDKTIQIAKSYGKKVKIIQTDNPPMFHINKQKALDAATGEWILQLDADEALSDELKKEIKSIIIPSALCHPESRSAGRGILRKPILDSSVATLPRNDAYIAYYLPRKNWFLNRFLMKGGQYPDYTIRLYKNGVAHFPCKDVHENVVVNGEVGYLKSPLLHYSDPTFSRYWERWKRYTKLEAERFVGAFTPKKPSFINYIIIKPIVTFFLMYFRHKGFMDGWAGFIFALFSSIRFWGIYFKWVSHPER